jgi:hypothetical protein
MRVRQPVLVSLAVRRLRPGNLNSNLNPLRHFQPRICNRAPPDNARPDDFKAPDIRPIGPG